MSTFGFRSICIALRDRRPSTRKTVINTITNTGRWMESLVRPIASFSDGSNYHGGAEDTEEARREDVLDRIVRIDRFGRFGKVILACALIPRLSIATILSIQSRSSVSLCVLRASVVRLFRDATPAY